MNLPRSVHTDTRVGRVIQTRYAGRYFRSRTEARWAVLFDALGLDWQYEPERYRVRGKSYLPDFWITDWDAWFEVKPKTEEHNVKSLVWMLQQLRRDTRARQAYVCFGAPDLMRGSSIFDDQCVYEWVNEFGPVCESPAEGVAYEAYRIAMEERFEGRLP
jgi:hypothetical protein